MAKAAPSRGSVPEPGSSSKTNDSSVDDSKMRFNRRMCAPNVDNPLSPSCNKLQITKSHLPFVLTNGKICCSAPSPLSPHGGYNPALAMSTRMPNVFNEAVLPPVFGPVIAAAFASASMWKLIGTTFDWQSNRVRCSSLKLSSPSSPSTLSS